MVRVNFAEVESFEKLDAGTYHFAITDLDVDETGEESKHPGTDFWKAELTVQDGPLQGRKEFLSIMLPPYELYTLVGILRATVGQHEWTEEEVEQGEVDVEMDDLMGLEFIAKVKPQKKNPDFNQVSNFKPYDPESWEESDLLP